MASILPVRGNASFAFDRHSGRVHESRRAKGPARVTGAPLGECCIRVLSAFSRCCCRGRFRECQQLSNELRSYFSNGLTDVSPGPLLNSMASPRFSTRHFGIRKPAQVWTDAASRQSPAFGPGA